MKKLSSLKHFKKSLIDAKVTAAIEGGIAYGSCNTDSTTQKGGGEFDSNILCDACGASNCDADDGAAYLHG